LAAAVLASPEALDLVLHEIDARQDDVAAVARNGEYLPWCDDCNDYHSRGRHCSPATEEKAPE